MKAAGAVFCAVSLVFVFLPQSFASTDTPEPLPTPAYVDGRYLAKQTGDHLTLIYPPKFFASHRFFSIDLSLNKPTYKMGETIQLLITITNVSDNPMEFLTNFFLSEAPFFLISHRSISVIVTSPAGDTIDSGIYCRATYGRELFDERNVITIAPSESIRSRTDFHSSDQGCYGMSNPGLYTLSAVYTNMYREPPIEKVWVGQIESNRVQFELMP